MSVIHKIVFMGAALTGLVGAQTKISGTQTCAKPDISQVAQVGDSKGHVLMLMQQKCTWSKPIEIEGAQTKDDIGSMISDIRAATSHDQGYDIGTMSNGDKIYVRFIGASKMKDNMPESIEGKWSFVGGTGKLKSIKGGGTYKGKGNPDGTSTADIEGEYTLSMPPK